MAGTKQGGLKARDANKEKYGADFYARIGSKGGKKSTNGGFGAGEEGRKRASHYGKIGGAVGTRAKDKDNIDPRLQTLRLKLKNKLISYEEYMAELGKL